MKAFLFQMAITYSCITRGTTILCSHQTGSGSFENVVLSILNNIPMRNDGKTTFQSERYYFAHQSPCGKK